MGQALHLLLGSRTFARMTDALNQTVVHRGRCLTRTGRLKSPVEGARPGLAWEVSHGERWAGKEKERGSLAVVLASSKV